MLGVCGAAAISRDHQLIAGAKNGLDQVGDRAYRAMKFFVAGGLLQR